MSTEKMLLDNRVVAGKSLNKWIELFKQHLLTINFQFDLGHRLDHVERVANTATKLAYEENALLEIVIPAVWLHDCVAISKFSPERTKSSKISAEFALNLLTEHQYPIEYFTCIKNAIESHSYSANIKPISLEAKVVQDADRLDALGAIGIARTIIVGSKGEIPLYDTKDPFARNRPLNDTKNTLDHFFIKLLKLKNTLWTESARREAEIRTEFMVQFLKHLSNEIGTPFDETILESDSVL